MNHVFWQIPNELAGRPGPNVHPWDLSALYSGGIRSILTLNLGVGVEREGIVSAGIAHAHIRFPKGEPPDADALRVGLDALPAAYAWFESRVNAGPVLVHCSHGKDRTCLFMAYALMKRRGVDAATAIGEVKRVRPIALSAEGWTTFATGLLSALEK